MAAAELKFVRQYTTLGIDDVAIVGGKNASLGEMIKELGKRGVKVSDGFATTAEAFRDFLSVSGLDVRIEKALKDLDVSDTRALRSAGESIRGWILDATLPEVLCHEILTAYRQLNAADAAAARAHGLEVDEGTHLATVAVRSSATAEDLPDASFAGQQETYLNIEGEAALLRTVKRVMASLYTDRAISYRAHHGFAHMAVALSVGVQKMVRSDLACSGVLFTLDTESGFPGVCLITGAYGLGETVVQGSVNPDEWLVFKPILAADDSKVPIVRSTLGSKAIKLVYSTDRITADSTSLVEVDRAARERFCLDDAEVLQLARYGSIIEAHYSAQSGMWRPMDVEWAKDGLTGELFVVQARPETVHAARARNGAVVSVFKLGAHEDALVLAVGRAVGAKIGCGRVRVILEARNMQELQNGEVLVTDITDPDWEPVMKRASAIVTARGGRVCHAAIVARELGIPAVVGAAGATQDLADGQVVTVVCSEGDNGIVYQGALPFSVREVDTSSLPRPRKTKVSLILGNPSEAFSLAALPVRGVGLARLEFIINSVGLHPKAALEVDSLPSQLAARVREACIGSPSPAEHYIRGIAEGVACISAAFYPQPVIVRLSDFKTNEYRGLLGGERYEPQEENPMLGWRGASRYHSPDFGDAFALECEALRRVRDVMGLTNTEIMIPFVRSTQELRAVLDVMAANGLRRGDGATAACDEAVEAAANGAGRGLKVHIMCEVPSNALLADDFLQLCDGFSIGSNDLTQLTLGVDRDSSIVKGFDERDAAVKMLIGMAIDAAQRAGKYIGICGQAPSDFPAFAAWLVQRGIGAISLNPDAVVNILQTVVDAEAAAGDLDAQKE